MNFKYKVSTVALAIAGFVAVESHLSPAFAQIDEIIVTARKREQSLQTVPIAVSAFSGATLADSGIRSTSDLQEIVPNLSMFPGSAGNRYTLRGQSLNEGLITEDPSVNINVNGVYVARPHAGTIPFVDVAQVEVLRGPQGTLFGRNTTGGAINITTKLPEYDWGGVVGGRLGNFQRGDAWGSLNIPIIEDTLAVRAALELKNAGGDGDNKSTLGQSPFDEDAKSFFGSLLWEPTDSLDVVIHGDWAQSNNNYFDNASLVNIDPVGTGGGFGALGSAIYAETNGAAALGALLAGPPAAIGPALGAAAFGAFATYGQPNAQGGLPYASTHNTPNTQTNDTAGVSATVTWEGDLLSIKTVLAKRWIYQTTLYDLDGTPFRLLDTQQLLDHSQTSAEIQFYGDTDLFGRNLDWIAGVFYFEEEADQGSTSVALGAINPLVPNVIFGRGENDSIAGFAELDYEILEDFRITMGGRYTVDTKYAANRNAAGFFPSAAAAAAFAGGAPVIQHSPVFLDLLPDDSLNGLVASGRLKTDDWAVCRVPAAQQIPAGNCFTENEDQFRAFSWNFGWDWTAWDDGANSALVYANYKRSFRSGGQNFRSTFDVNAFDPEFVRQIAAGMKLDLLDGNLRFNVEGFHQAITDKQVFSVVAAAGAGLGTIISNAASANVKGVEFEMNWTPLPDTLEGLQLNGALGWTDPVYNSFPDVQPLDPSLALGPANPLVPISRANEPFTRVTELSANASIVYNHALFDSCDGNLLTRLDWTYKSDTSIQSSSDFDANKPSFGPLASQSSGDYFLINARSALSLFDNMIELGVWCKNCTDNQYIATALDLRDSLGYAVAGPSNPRTFGGDLTYRWGSSR